MAQCSSMAGAEAGGEAERGRRAGWPGCARGGNSAGAGQADRRAGAADRGGTVPNPCESSGGSVVELGLHRSSIARNVD
ncbi:unnamed protein product [Rangifer tarandus platyrhynchus]|uniref:Uncharacterized protein n=1 Tax=Rangifer tarandus platyrhynchus TaxID=3082113 RepID=A0ABN8XYN4_RANTA|nr:unnamed protein product [Rangifer tarandus platyrhynchus]